MVPAVSVNTRLLVLIPDDQVDSSGDIFDLNGIEFASGDVPVVVDFQDDQCVGSARLTKAEDGRIFADVALRPDVDFDQISRLTPAVGGISLEVVPTDAYRVIRKAVVNRIGLTDKANCDTRIKSIGEQVS